MLTSTLRVITFLAGAWNAYLCSTNYYSISRSMNAHLCSTIYFPQFHDLSPFPKKIPINPRFVTGGHFIENDFENYRRNSNFIKTSVIRSTRHKDRT
jgi:L-alanine-DL-glutamate epimerase-like enolase superfamily enzyme